MITAYAAYIGIRCVGPQPCSYFTWGFNTACCILRVLSGRGCWFFPNSLSFEQVSPVQIQSAENDPSCRCCWYCLGLFIVSSFCIQISIQYTGWLMLCDLPNCMRITLICTCIVCWGKSGMTANINASCKMSWDRRYAQVMVTLWFQSVSQQCHSVTQFVVHPKMRILVFSWSQFHSGPFLWCCCSTEPCSSLANLLALGCWIHLIYLEI